MVGCVRLRIEKCELFLDVQVERRSTSEWSKCGFT